MPFFRKISPAAVNISALNPGRTESPAGIIFLQYRASRHQTNFFEGALLRDRRSSFHKFFPFSGKSH